MPFIAEPQFKPRPTPPLTFDEKRITLAKGIISALVGVVVLGLVMCVALAALFGEVSGLRADIIDNRVIGCQRTLDEGHPLPKPCMESEIRRQLTGAP